MQGLSCSLSLRWSTALPPLTTLNLVAQAGYAGLVGANLPKGQLAFLLHLPPSLPLFFLPPSFSSFFSYPFFFSSLLGPNGFVFVRINCARQSAPCVRPVRVHTLYSHLIASSSHFSVLLTSSFSLSFSLYLSFFFLFLHLSFFTLSFKNSQTTTTKTIRASAEVSRLIACLDFHRQ